MFCGFFIAVLSREPQEPQLLATAEPDRNTFRFRNRIWIRIERKIEYKGQK
jgi:hypothetical protein